MMAPAGGIILYICCPTTSQAINCSRRTPWPSLLDRGAARSAKEGNGVYLQVLEGNV